MTRYSVFRVRQISIMLIGYALFYVCRLAFSATKKAMIETGAYTAREIGLVGSSMLVAYAIGKMASGVVADHVNVRKLFAGGLFVSSFMTLLVGFHVPAIVLMVLWFVNGIAQSTGAPSCVVSLSRWWPRSVRGTFYGIFSCSNNLGEALAYVVTGVIMVRVGAAYGPDLAWRSGFWGAAAIGFVGVALIALVMRNRPEDVGLEPVRESVAEVTDVKSGQRLAFTSIAVWMVALAGAFFCMSRYAIIDWGIFFLEVKKGYSTQTAATIIAINSIVGAISSALCGVVSDRWFKSSRYELAIVAGIMSVVGLAIFMLVPFACIWLDVLAMVLFGLAVGVLLTFVGGLMAVDLVPKVAAGAALGIAGMGNYLGAGLQSFASGYLVARDPISGKAVLMSHHFGGYNLDYLAVFWIGMSLLSVVCVLLTWSLAKRKGV